MWQANFPSSLAIRVLVLPYHEHFAPSSFQQFHDYIVKPVILSAYRQFLWEPRPLTSESSEGIKSYCKWHLKKISVLWLVCPSEFDCSFFISIKRDGVGTLFHETTRLLCLKKYCHSLAVVYRERHSSLVGSHLKDDLKWMDTWITESPNIVVVICAFSSLFGHWQALQ